MRRVAIVGLLVVLACVDQATVNHAIAAATPQPEMDPAALDGGALESQFASEGIGARAHIDITKDEIYQVFIQDPVQLLFNEGVRFATPVTVREFHYGDRAGYSIDVMASAATPSGMVVRGVVPIGPGTVYAVFGKVSLFGNEIAAYGQAPLVFVVHNALNLEEAKPSLLSRGRLVPVELNSSVKTVAQSHQGTKGLFLQLVHVGGKGHLKLKGGADIEL